MRKLLTATLDLLFPPPQQELLVRHATAKSVLEQYAPINFQQTICLSQYSNPLTQALLKQNKFHHSHKAAQHLGELLHQWHITQSGNTHYIPIPLGKKRLRTRGHNQVLSILHAAQLDGVTRTDILLRKIETKAQANLDKQARLKNIQNAFAINPQALHTLTDTHLVLVDDVVTTGATLLAAKQALLPHLPKSATLTLLALAH